MIINFLGDSITEGSGATCRENCFVSMVGKILNCKVNNYGIGGTRIARQKELSEYHICDMDFNLRADFLDKNADYVFVFGGTNDYGHGKAEFGKIGDKTVYTFCGAVYVLVKKLIKKFGKKKVVFILPLKRYKEEVPNVITGKSLVDYVNAIKEIVSKAGIKILDLYDNGLSIDKINDYFSDGLHPNDTGHKIIAEKICEYIEHLNN